MTDAVMRDRADRVATEWSILTTLKAQRLRYLHITAWALPVWPAAGWEYALAWFALAVAQGLARGRFERWAKSQMDEGGKFGPTYTAVATLSSLVWSLAPAILWFSGESGARLAAVVLLATGGMLVMSQFRSSPARTACVSSPYAVLLGIFAVTLIGQPAFTIFIFALPAFMAAAAHKVFHAYQTHQRIIEARLDQERLIGDLREARDEAEAANRAKSAFLATVSHEIRTPMNGILGGAQLLERSDLDTAQRRFVAMLKTSGGALLNLLNDVLDLSKIEADGLRIEAIEFAFDELLCGVRDGWSLAAEEKGLELTLDLGEAPAAIMGDPTRVTQIMNNLISNAIKFTETGGIAIAVRADPGDGEKTTLSISVTDTGLGVEPAALDRLFRPFEQYDASITRRYGGTGLGLAICRRLAEAMDGAVTASSAPGQGSTFTLTLPARVVSWPRQHECPQAAEGPPAGESFRLSVLLVEDNPINQAVAEAMLTPLGCEVAIAENGREALNQAALQRFDVILMDVHMPVLDGLTATRQLRSEAGPNAATPVIMLSASAMPEESRAGFAAGADAYLTKPIDPARLYAALGELKPVLETERAGAA